MFIRKVASVILIPASSSGKTLRGKRRFAVLCPALNGTHNLKIVRRPVIFGTPQNDIRHTYGVTPIKLLEDKAVIEDVKWEANHVACYY
jgi:hypothetical protein